MRPFIAFILVFFNLPLAEAQINLVPNPSFEDTLNCDSFHFNQVSSPWFTPTNCTPDYFYGISPTCGNSAFQNPSGFQLPLDGISYVGIYLAMPLTGIGTREYITTELLDTLISGKNYKLEFFISRANAFYLATDDIGAYLSQQAPNGSGCFYLPLIPQIENPQGNIITDSTNWTSISGIYNAVGGEKYLTIGNFKDSSVTTIIDADNGNGDYQNAYYYIDKVSLISLDSLQGIQPSNDVSLLLDIFPTVTNSGSLITINIKSEEQVVAQVYSSDGRLNKNLVFTNGTNYLNTSGMNAGLYFIAFKFNNVIIYKKVLLI
ncbi:MAG: T9SS type A sorting domain-containing protein [Bacteroidia bacterium]|nr:T9SS type A sorting domain-containing protein [Bacteroidia bacterium]